MKNIPKIPQSEEIKLLGTYLSRAKIQFSKAEVSTKLGRFLTFRELQLLHRQRTITDAELGFYMDMKGSSTISQVQLDELVRIHKKLQ